METAAWSLAGRLSRQQLVLLFLRGIVAQSGAVTMMQTSGLGGAGCKQGVRKWIWCLPALMSAFPRAPFLPVLTPWSEDPQICNGAFQIKVKVDVEHR